MGEVELATIVAQFGVAGLIGWMWMMERRSATDRERQLTEAHELLRQEHKHLDVLVAVLDRNTRALASLEAGQRELSLVLRQLHGMRESSEPGSRIGDLSSGEAA